MSLNKKFLSSKRPSDEKENFDDTEDRSETLAGNNDTGKHWTDHENTEHARKRMKRGVVCHEQDSGICSCDDCRKVKRSLDSVLVEMSETDATRNPVKYLDFTHVGMEYEETPNDKPVVRVPRSPDPVTVELESNGSSVTQNIDANETIPAEGPTPMRKPVKKFPSPLSEMLGLKESKYPGTQAQLHNPENAVYRNGFDGFDQCAPVGEPDDQSPCCSKSLKPTNVEPASNEPTSSIAPAVINPGYASLVEDYFSHRDLMRSITLDLQRITNDLLENTLDSPKNDGMSSGGLPPPPSSSVPDYMEYADSADPNSYLGKCLDNEFDFYSTFDEDDMWKMGFAKCSQGHYYLAGDSLCCIICGEMPNIHFHQATDDSESD